MASELIAVGTTAATSSDFTVSAGTPVTLFLKVSTSIPVDSNASVELQIKSVGSTYHAVATITGREPAMILDAPGTYRLSKAAGPAFGVDRE